MTQPWFGMVSGRVRDGGEDGGEDGRKKKKQDEGRAATNLAVCSSMQKMRTIMGDGGRIICLPKRRALLPYRI